MFKRLIRKFIKPNKATIQKEGTVKFFNNTKGFGFITINDSEEETKQLCGWVTENLGPETPLHFSRFFPQNQLKHLPPTPTDTILRAREIARSAGLQYVYVGNMQSDEGENTYCPNCSKLLIARRGYTVHKNLAASGRCPACHAQIPGIWK